VLVIFSEINNKKKDNSTKWYKSIRVNLLVIIALIGLLPILFLFRSVLVIYNNNARQIRLTEVKNYVNIVKGMISDQASAQGGKLEKVEQKDIYNIAQVYGYRIKIFDKNGKNVCNTLISYSENYSATAQYTISDEVKECIKSNKEIVSEKEDVTQLIVPITVVSSVSANDSKNDDPNVIGSMVVEYDNTYITKISDVLTRKMELIALILAIPILTLAIWYSKKIQTSLRKITKSIENVKEGYMDEMVVINDFRETNEMTTAFNAMLARIQQLENSRQEFVSNVSHELKTPITSIKVLADSLIAQGEETPAELYREFMVDITEELERENKIINDLLALVKLDKTTSDLNVASISINDLLELLLKRLRPLAAKRNIEITFESLRVVNAEVDEVKISLAFSNLIENAIKYNYEDGWIKVTLNADHKYFYVSVEDSGVGIPKDCQDSIFDRFYRVDKARSRDTGGSGLGLSITRNVIILHKGSIRVHSKEKEGTKFSVRIPLNYVP